MLAGGGDSSVWENRLEDKGRKGKVLRCTIIVTIPKRRSKGTSKLGGTNGWHVNRTWARGGRGSH